MKESLPCSGFRCPTASSAFKTSPQEKKEFLSLLHEKELPDCCREARKRLGAFSSKGAGDVNAEDVRVLSMDFLRCLFNGCISSEL